jgi:hypothetical protein
MQDLEHDMDELFRKAAKEYPLKTGDNWNAIAAKIAGNKVDPEAKEKFLRPGKLSALLLFLLMFLFTSMFLLLPTSNKYGEIQTNPIGEKNGTFSTTVAGNQISSRQDIKNKTSQLTSLQDAQLIYSTMKARTSAISNTYKIEADVLDETIAQGSMEEINSIGQGFLFEFPSLKNNMLPFAPEKQLFPALAEKQENTKKGGGKSSIGGFYYGIRMGPGLSAVKKQALKRTGFDIGLLMGYRLSDTWSVESGLLYARKYYVTDGKYFDMGIIGPMMPAGMEVMKIEGTSRVLEIPMHLRFDFTRNRQQRFFSSAGFSSFIMTEEKNRYHTMYNGTEAKMIASYKKDRRYFAAAFDLSAGYEKQLGNKYRLRIEPYVQIPVKGVGVGNLQVIKTGISLGLTRTAN